MPRWLNFEFLRPVILLPYASRRDIPITSNPPSTLLPRYLQSKYKSPFHFFYSALHSRCEKWRSRLILCSCLVRVNGDRLSRRWAFSHLFIFAGVCCSTADHLALSLCLNYVRATSYLGGHHPPSPPNIMAFSIAVAM